MLTRQLAKRAAGQTVFEALLREEASIQFDLALFNAAAEDPGVSPAGLLHNVTPIAGNGDVERDVEALLAALAAAGGSGNAAIIANPVEAAVLQIRMPELAVPVWATRALAAGVVVALDPAAFTSAFGTNPDIEVSKAATLHMSDTPAELMSDSGPTTAAPIRSTWQTDTIAVRLLADVAFTMRAPGL